MCASGWGNLKNIFENVLLAVEILKKVKNVKKRGRTMFVYQWPEAHSIFSFSPARSTFHFLFLTFPQPEAHPETQILTSPQPEAHPKIQF